MYILDISNTHTHTHTQSSYETECTHCRQGVATHMQCIAIHLDTYIVTTIFGSFCTVKINIPLCSGNPLLIV